MPATNAARSGASISNRSRSSSSSASSGARASRSIGLVGTALQQADELVDPRPDRVDVGDPVRDQLRHLIGHALDERLLLTDEAVDGPDQVDQHGLFLLQPDDLVVGMLSLPGRGRMRAQQEAAVGHQMLPYWRRITAFSTENTFRAEPTATSRPSVGCTATSKPLSNPP